MCALPPVIYPVTKRRTTPKPTPSRADRPALGSPRFRNLFSRATPDLSGSLHLGAPDAAEGTADAIFGQAYLDGFQDQPDE